jgi:hypothetical protein
MSRQVFIPLIVLTILTLFLMAGGFTSLAQFDMRKVGEKGVLQPIEEAREKTISNLADAMAGTTPTPTEEAEAIPLEEIPEDVLRDAIAAVNEFRMFADSATKIVRSYITQIKIKPDMLDIAFEAGKEPWMSEKAEARYSPFDPELVAPQGIRVDMVRQQAFLPPLGPMKSGPSLEMLRGLVKLKMTSKSGDEYFALAEIAGVPVQLTAGASLDPGHKVLPPDLDVRVDEISLDSVLFTSGADYLRVPFAGPLSTEERPFDIEIGY